MLTDWVDTGHLPEHPREYATEAVLGAIIGACVWLLYRDARRLEHLAQTDGLTSLRNRRSFREDLEREMARAKRLGTALSIAYVDVDQFKRVNDQHGHGVGDRVLQMVATGLQGLRRNVDQGYRLGGDEFAAILPGATPEAALGAVERALEQGWAAESRGLPSVALSMGAVEMASDDTLDGIVARADRAMYAAKQSTDGVCADGLAFRRVRLGNERSGARRPTTPSVPPRDPKRGRASRPVPQTS